MKACGSPKQAAAYRDRFDFGRLRLRAGAAVVAASVEQAQL
jgi:hypothetical protein